MKSFTITTPVPSVNSMYRGRRFLTKEGKATKHAISMEILAQRNFEPHSTPVALNIIFYFGNNRKNDIDNRLKALLDCLTGVIYEDDSLVTEMHIFKEYDKENPRVELQIL